MHSCDQRKDAEAFHDEVDAILAGTSRFHRPRERFNFPRFVFPAADFGEARFTQGADFGEARFTQEADFGRVTFTQGANFWEAMFSEDADFSRSLWGPSKGEPVVEQVELAVADFRDAKFLKPELVRFLRVNEEGKSGFRARFVNCPIKGVSFEDVHWHREKGRMVLQDELDRLANVPETASCEQVAAAYRRFIINFDEAKHYDLAEDCMVGAMEMKRLDPAKFLFAGRLGPFYEKWSWLRWLGEHVSVTNLYRLASNYGSSYVHAFGVLILLLFSFALLFTLSGVDPNPNNRAAALAPAGLIHAVEVVTFQSPTRYVVGSGLGWFLEQVERLFVAAQVALFLLALRRRFRR